MKGIENEMKRGRPDLVHFSILELHYQFHCIKKIKFKIFVHTIDDKVIEILGQNVHIYQNHIIDLQD